jgi:hypothetical protein
MIRNYLLLTLSISILGSCQSPTEEINKMPKEIQRSVLAEFGREALVDALREVEGKTPVSYVEIEDSAVNSIRETVQRATLFSSAITRVVGHKFTGTIQSTALAADFKDFQIEVTYVASNGSDISSQDFTIYRTCRAGDSEPFEFLLDRPDQTSRYRYVILGAERAN